MKAGDRVRLLRPFPVVGLYAGHEGVVAAIEREEFGRLVAVLIRLPGRTALHRLPPAAVEVDPRPGDRVRLTRAFEEIPSGRCGTVVELEEFIARVRVYVLFEDASRTRSVPSDFLEVVPPETSPNASVPMPTPDASPARSYGGSDSDEGLGSSPPNLPGTAQEGA